MGKVLTIVPLYINDRDNQGSALVIVIGEGYLLSLLSFFQVRSVAGWLSRALAVTQQELRPGSRT